MTRLLESGLGTMLRIATTFILCCCSWVIFRAPSLATATSMLRQMVTPPWTGIGLPSGNELCGLLILVAVCHLVGHLSRRRPSWGRLPGPVQGFAYAAVMITALLLSPDVHKAFIYFQF